MMTSVSRCLSCIGDVNRSRGKVETHQTTIYCQSLNQVKATRRARASSQLQCIA